LLALPFKLKTLPFKLYPLTLKFISLAISMAAVVMAIPIVAVSRSAIDPELRPAAIVNPNAPPVDPPVVPLNASGLTELAVEFDIILISTTNITVHSATIIRFTTKVLSGPRRHGEENRGECEGRNGSVRGHRFEVQ
jgi:hypothetical protein